MCYDKTPLRSILKYNFLQNECVSLLKKNQSASQKVKEIYSMIIEEERGYLRNS